MSHSTEYIINRLDEATRVNRESKQVCNDALSLARGRIQSLQIEVEWKDARIAELDGKIEKKDAIIKDLEEQVQALMSYAGDLYSKSGSAEISSGQGTDGCEDRWIPCSERMPLYNENVLIKIVDQLNTCRYFVFRTGHLRDTEDPTTCAWFVWGEPGVLQPLTDDFKVIAWHPLPEDYVEPEVKPDPVEEVKFEAGDFVLCLSGLGSCFRAIYLSEDEEHYWIYDKKCETPQHLYKTQWMLIKSDKIMNVIDWLNGKED